MRKIYMAILAALLLTNVFTVANAQRKIGPLPASAKKITVPSVSNVVSGTTADCDTVNFPIPETWNLVISGPLGGDVGFILGTNEYRDLEKANYFDLSATSNTYITGASIFFWCSKQHCCW